MNYEEPRHNKRKWLKESVKRTMKADYKKLSWLEKLLLVLGIVAVFLMFFGATR